MALDVDDVKTLVVDVVVLWTEAAVVTIPESLGALLLLLVVADVLDCDELGMLVVVVVVDVDGVFVVVVADEVVVVVAF